MRWLLLFSFAFLMVSCHHEKLRLEQLNAMRLEQDFTHSLLTANIEIWDSIWPCPDDSVLVVTPKKNTPVIRHARVSVNADKRDSTVTQETDSVQYVGWLEYDKAAISTHDYTILYVVIIVCFLLIFYYFIRAV